MRGAIGHDKGCAFGKRHGLWHGDAALGIQGQFLGHTAPAGRADHPIANLEVGDALANGLNHAGNLAARGKGAGGLELILVLDNQHVRIVDPAGLDRQKHFTSARYRIGQVLNHQGFWTTDALAQHCLHCFAPV